MEDLASKIQAAVDALQAVQQAIPAAPAEDPVWHDVKQVLTSNGWTEPAGATQIEVQDGSEQPAA